MILKEHNGSEYASARELHQALGIKKPISQWMKYNIHRAELEEKEDYVTILLQSTGGRQGVDFYLTEQAAIGLIMMSGGQHAKQIRKLVIQAFQEKQKGQSFDHKEITALMDLSKAMILVSLQKEVERKHAKIYDHPPTWWARRAELLGYSTKDVIEAMKQSNRKHQSTRKSLIKLDADELIRTGVIDFFKALGKTDEYATNAGDLCKKMSKKMDCGVNIWDDTQKNPLQIQSKPVKEAIKLKPKHQIV